MPERQLCLACSTSLREGLLMFSSVGPLGVAYFWGLLTFGGCLLLGVAYFWGLLTFRGVAYWGGGGVDIWGFPCFLYEIHTKIICTIRTKIVCSNNFCMFFA